MSIKYQILLYLLSMKWLAVLLSIYVLSLACMPCVDEIDHNCTSQTEQSSNQTSDQNHHQSNACSPFCVCVCCNVTVVVANFVVNTSPIAFQRKSFVPVYENILSNYNHSIWQPPKIG